MRVCRARCLSEYHASSPCDFLRNVGRPPAAVRRTHLTPRGRCTERETNKTSYEAAKLKIRQVLLWTIFNPLQFQMVHTS